jgi:MOSC domain-containing protein YiiM
MSKPTAKESIIGKLLDAPLKPGRVVWISVRPERRVPVKSLTEVEAIQDRGLAGDHYRGTASSNRHVTLIQAEHLTAVASFMNLPNWTQD